MAIRLRHGMVAALSVMSAFLCVCVVVMLSTILARGIATGIFIADALVLVIAICVALTTMVACMCALQWSMGRAQ